LTSKIIYVNLWSNQYLTLTNKFSTMKTLTFFLILLPVLALSQVKAVREFDAMSGKATVYADRAFAVANEDNTIGFRVDAIMNDELVLRGLLITMVGIGSCNEEDEMIILFDSGERIIKKSIKGFNCDGEALYSLSEKDLMLLRNQSMSKMRMTNGSSFESYTGDVRPDDKNYFIELLESIDSQRVVKN
jgi:hypothetical protein